MPAARDTLRRWGRRDSKKCTIPYALKMSVGMRKKKERVSEDFAHERDDVRGARKKMRRMRYLHLSLFLKRKYIPTPMKKYSIGVIGDIPLNPNR